MTRKRRIKFDLFRWRPIRPGAVHLHVPNRPTILLVCTANICRSPMAEGVLRKMLAKRGIRAYIDSAATHDYCLDMPPYPMAVSVTKARGYNIVHVVARKVSRRDFDLFDLVVAMDLENARSLKRVAPRRARSKIRLLLDFTGRFRGQDVPDPFGGKAQDFKLALERIEAGCRGVVRAIESASRPHRSAASVGVPGSVVPAR